MCARATVRDDRGDDRRTRDEQSGNEPDDDEAYDDELDDDEAYYDEADDDEADEDDLDDELDDDEAPYEAGEDERDEAERPARGGRTAGRRPEVLSAPLAARAGLRHIADLTGKEPSGVTSLEPAEDGWLVGVEVVEDRRIPSSTDILGLYMTQIRADGSLVTYRRTRRYPRGRGDSSEVI